MTGPIFEPGTSKAVLLAWLLGIGGCLVFWGAGLWAAFPDH